MWCLPNTPEMNGWIWVDINQKLEIRYWVYHIAVIFTAVTHITGTHLNLPEALSKYWRSWKAQVGDLCVIAQVILNPNTHKSWKPKSKPPKVQTLQNHKKKWNTHKTNHLNPKTRSIKP